MRIDSAVDAVGFFEPELGSAQGAQAVRAVLDQARAEPRLDRVALTDHDRTILGGRHRLAPLIQRGWPEAEPEEDWRRLAVAQMRLDATAQEVASWLSEASIDCRVLKGLATGPLDYSNPLHRQTGDVDLLVGLENFEVAEATILERGCSRDGVQRLAGRLMQGSTLIHPSGTEIDLHYRIDRHFPTAPSPVMMADPVIIEGNMRAFPAELRLIHAAHHAFASPLSNRRLSSVADIVAILDNTGVDWGEARKLADRLGFTGTVAEALRMEALIMGRKPHAGLEWPALSRFEALAFRAHERRMPFRHLLALQNLPSGSSKLDYMRQWVLPSADYIRQRGGTRAYVRDLFRGLSD